MTEPQPEDRLDVVERRLRALERAQATYIVATVTATDADTSTFTAVLEESGQVLSGISAPAQFLPAVQDQVRLSVYGATIIYEPSSLTGIDPANVGNLAGLNVTDDPRIMGELFSTHMERKAQLAAWTNTINDPGQTNSELGIAELSFVAQKGHAYLVVATGLQPEIGGGGDNHTVPFNLRATFDGTSPLVSSYLMGSSRVRTAFDLFPWENPTSTVMGMHHEAVGGRTVRVGLSMAKPTAATYVQLVQDTYLQEYMFVLDLGLTIGDTGQPNAMGGTLLSGAVPPPPPSTVKTNGATQFVAGWMSNFQGDGDYVPYTQAWQGYSPRYPADGNMRAFLGGFRDENNHSMATTLAGATIRYVKAFVWYSWWHYSNGGIPVIGVHTNDAQVFTPTGQGPDKVLGPAIGRNAGTWIDLPLTWGNWFRDSVAAGIALGPADSLDPTYAGSADTVNHPPVIEIGWTR